MESNLAKQCLSRDDRSRALLALRRKKYQESLLAKTDAQLAQLEQLTGQVEFALVQKDVLFGLQQGTEVLQTIHKEMGGVEGVEKLMGDTEDARAYQEVSIFFGLDGFLPFSLGCLLDLNWMYIHIHIHIHISISQNKILQTQQPNLSTLLTT